MDVKRIESFRDLIIWQKSIDLVENIYQITDKLPKKETWVLLSQMRRAAISIPSNIAEGYGRHTTGEYKHYLSISRGSLLELETQIYICQRLKFFTLQEIELILLNIQEINKMFNSLINKMRNQER